jgi:CRISPR-associated protein Csm3
MANQIQLKKKIIVRGKITALTGIAIGGSNSAMNIGGVDKGVIRNPINNQPYIPGSTLKGKMRSLIELRDGTIGDKPMGAVKNGPSERAETMSVKLFGSASNDDKQRPSRVVVRDAYLTEEQIREGSDFFKNTDLPYTEVKTEVVIDRITSKAMPRQLERVPAGAQFDFEAVVNIFEEDGVSREEELMQNLFAAIRLVQDDYIGGSGSRGSGRIAFDIAKVEERDTAYYTSGDEIHNATDKWRKYFPQ